jgi:hypothetical protein
MPRVGTRARVAHFGGGFQAGTVVALEDDGRRLTVRCSDGELLDFVLNPATARFIAAGSGSGPRLELLGD